MPLAETLRRWGTGNYILWVDDYLVGVALLVAYWRTRSDGEGARPWLAAAWGFTCGIGYMAFIGHGLSIGPPDVSGLDSRLVTGVLGVAVLMATLALWASLRPTR